MRKAVHITTLLILGQSSSVLAGAQPSPDVPAERIDAVFAELNRTDSPGCSLGVVREGRLIYRKGYGMANLELHVPMTAQTVGDIGSITKQFTVMAVLMLAQEGKLSLDDDVREYVPELRNHSKVITTRHLIHHTSGLRDYITLLGLAGRDDSDVVADPEAFALLARQTALNFTPGERFSYSNSGYILMSLIVKRVSGKTLPEFAQQRIFTPLGMIHTGMHDDVDLMLVPNRATGHYPRDWPRQSKEMKPAVYRFKQVGDGGIFTTVEDLALWDENFYTAQVGGAALLEQMHVTGVLSDATRIAYAGGLTVERYRGLRRVSHGGGGGGFSSAMTRFPDQHFSTIVICNKAIANSTGAAQAVADLYLADAYTEPAPPDEDAERMRQILKTVAMEDASTEPLSAAQLASYPGSYWSEDLGMRYRVEAVDRAIRVHIADRVTRPLTWKKGDTFYMENGFTTIEFARARTGKVTGFDVRAGEVELSFSRAR